MDEADVNDSRRVSDLSQLKALLWPMGFSLLIGVLTLALATHPPHWVLYLTKRVAGLIGGIGGIVQSSEHPTDVVLIMALELPLSDRTGCGLLKAADELTG